MATQGVNGLAVAAAAGGVLLVWSGFKGASVTSGLRALLSGQQPSGANVNPVTTPASPSPGAPGAPGSPAPAAPANVSGNMALGKLLAAPFGWATGANWNALVALWQGESGWSNTAKNPTTGAYGIAQALPPTKYPFLGQEAGGSHASVQIMWGLSYIKSVYGSPSAAYSAWLSRSPHWY